MGAPALIDAQSQSILNLLNAMAEYQGTHVETGGFVGAPTTPSTQATGAGGTLAGRVNSTALLANVTGVLAELAAQVDYVFHNGSFWSAISGKSAIWAIVLSTGTANDTPALADVAGAEATTGSQVAPTDTEISTALGHDNWVRLADVTVNRTADTTVTQSYDNAVRPSVTGVTRSLATSESAFNE